MTTLEDLIDSFDQKRRKSDSISLAYHQKLSIIDGLFNQLIAVLPSAYSPIKLLFLNKDAGSFRIYEKLFDLDEKTSISSDLFINPLSEDNLKTANQPDIVNLGEKIWSILENDIYIKKYIRISLLGSKSFSPGTLENYLLRIISKDTEVFVIRFFNDVPIIYKGKSEEHVYKSLCGFLFVVRAIPRPGYDLNEKQLIDFVSRINRIFEKFRDDLIDTLSEDQVQVAVRAVTMEYLLEAVKLESIQYGVRTVLHRLGRLLGIVAFLTDSFVDGEAVRINKDYYEKNIIRLKEEADNINIVKDQFTPSRNGDINFIFIRQLVDLIHQIFDACIENLSQNKILLTINENATTDRLFRKEILVPSQGLLEELIKLQLENCIQAIDRSKVSEPMRRVVEVEVFDSNEYVMISITNYADKIPEEVLSALNSGHVVSNTKGFGWGTLITRRILGLIGGRFNVDSPIKGNFGTRTTLSFRKVYNEIEGV